MDVQVVGDPEELDDPRDGQQREAERDPVHGGLRLERCEAEGEHGGQGEEQSENGHDEVVPRATVIHIPTPYAEREESMSRHPAGKGGSAPPAAPTLSLVPGGR